MAGMRVNAPVGYEPHKVYCLIIMFGIRQCRQQLRIARQATVAYRYIDAHQFLIDDPACTNIQVANLRIPHLSFGQPHFFAISDQGSMRIGVHEGIKSRGICLCDGIGSRILPQPPAVQDYQQSFLIAHK